MQPSTRNSVVLTVVWFMGILAISGLLGTIYLCRISSDPTLVAAAVKMIQTDPSSAMAAMNLLRSDAAIIAIVSGLTGVAFGGLNGFLNNTRSTPEGSVTSSTNTQEITKTPATDALPALPVLTPATVIPPVVPAPPPTET